MADRGPVGHISAIGKVFWLISVHFISCKHLGLGPSQSDVSLAGWRAFMVWSLVRWMSLDRYLDDLHLCPFTEINLLATLNKMAFCNLMEVVLFI